MFTFNVTSFKINKAIYFISSGYSIQNFFFALCIIDNDTENERKKKKKKKKKQERIGISRWKRLIELFLPVFHNVLFIDDKNWAIGQARFNFLFTGKLQTSNIATCAHHPASCIAHHRPMLSIFSSFVSS